MKSFNIAVIPGDGIAKEVAPQGIASPKPPDAGSVYVRPRDIGGNSSTADLGPAIANRVRETHPIGSG